MAYCLLFFSMCKSSELSSWWTDTHHVNYFSEIFIEKVPRRHIPWEIRIHSHKHGTPPIISDVWWDGKSILSEVRLSYVTHAACTRHTWYLHMYCLCTHCTTWSCSLILAWLLSLTLLRFFFLFEANVVTNLRYRFSSMMI